jgi:arabinose-5-phosphate isomerase
MADRPGYLCRKLKMINSPRPAENSKVKDNFSKVVELLRLEASAIERCAAILDRTSVERAIELLRCCESKVIVTGVGKSGIIAQKIAQTLTSTGTIAVFVHPSDALHGSLGVIAKGDVMIALSNSGETEEILAIVPTAKDRGVSLISIVGNSASSLALASDVVLDASVDKEACPLNLAPTTSTTVSLAIGDAIAMTLMEVKGLQVEDFAANHPGGRLGRRLTLRVKDLMLDPPRVDPSASWFDVVQAISKHALGAVTVAADDGELLGIVTDGDLRRTIERTTPGELDGVSARGMMTAGPIVASPEMLAYEALQLMENRPSQISVLPVVDDGRKCVGLLRLHDVVRSGL